MRNSNFSDQMLTGSSTALINYLMNIDSKPAYVGEDTFYFENWGDCLDIVMFGSYHIKLHYDPNYSNMDVASAEDGCGYGKEDLQYAADIMYERSRIVALAKDAGLLSTDVVECVA